MLELDAAHRIAAANATNRADDVSPDDFSDLCNVLRDIEFEIQDTPAHTLAGLAVKARVAVEYLPPQWGESRMLDDILRVLVDDVQRLAAQATV